MSDWSLVGGDPAPGDPPGIRTIAGRYRKVADHAESARTTLLQLKGDADGASWMGDAADKFKAELDGDLLDNLDKLQRSYLTAGTTLETYASAIERLQEQARDQLRQASAADEDRRSAEGQVADRGAVQRTAAARHRTQREYLEKLRREYANPAYSQPGNEAYLQQLNAKYVEAQHQLSQAQTALSDSERSVREATSRRDDARGRLGRATDRVRDVKHDRDRAVEEAKRGIDRAQSEGIKNKSWWQRAGEWAKGAVKWITKLENLQKVLDAISIACMVVAVVLAITGVGAPVAAALMTVAKVTSALSTAVTVARALKGEVSWGQVALDAALSFGLAKAGKGVLKGLAKPGGAFVKKFGLDGAKLVTKQGRFGFSRVLAGQRMPGLPAKLRASLIRGGRSALRRGAFPFHFPSTTVKNLSRNPWTSPLLLGRYTKDAREWAVREAFGGVAPKLIKKAMDATGTTSVLTEPVKGLFETSTARQATMPWTTVCAR